MYITYIDKIVNMLIKQGSRNFNILLISLLCILNINFKGILGNKNGFAKLKFFVRYFLF